MTEVKQFITEQTLEGRSQSEIADLLIDFCQRNGDVPIEEAHEQLRILWEKRSLPIITEEAIEQEEIKLKWYNSDPPRYELYWPDIGGNQPINLENMDALWSWTIVQKSMAERWRVVPDDLKPKDWHALLNKLIAKAEIIAEPGASDAAEILDILSHWIAQSESKSWSWHEIWSKPLYKEGFYYFRLEVFEQKALFAQNTRFFYQRYLAPRPKLYQVFGSVGGITTTQRFKKQILRVWQVPEGFNEPKEPVQGEFEETSEDVLPTDI